MNDFALISEYEREKCQRVADAFSELYEMYEDMIVLDAGRFGFVKLMYFDGTSFASSDAFNDSEKLFESLWYDWKLDYLFEPVKDTPQGDLSLDELYESQDPVQKQYIEKKRKEFWEKAFGGK